MKRKAFLAIAGCTVKRFDNMQLRDQLPFRPQFGPGADAPQAEYAQADYSVMDAFRMRVFLDAAENKGLSVEAAKYIAGNCDRYLRPVSARATPDGAGEDLWIFYAQGRPYASADTGEQMTPRTLGAGTLASLPAFMAEKVDRHENQFLVLINASLASLYVLAAALKSGVIEGDADPIQHVWERDYRTAGGEG